jgi:hypothetical protein
MFCTFWFLVCQILRIVSSQIKIERCCVQLKNFKILFFVKKNWLNDCRIGCKSSANLLELNEINVDLEKGLEQFEKAFERDEIVNL